ncbi:MAG: glycoside hydrolase family 13 protein [Bacteroidota bacterium]
MSRLALLLAPLAFLAAAPPAAQPQIERVEPGNWWTGMIHDDLQILLYGEGIGQTRATMAPHEGVTLDQAVQVENPNYLFLDLTVHDHAEAGTLAFSFDGPEGSTTLAYDLRERTREPGTYAQGFDSEDVIYLMVPDRFANGDPSNDSIAGMLEGVDRSDPDARQGGDFAGVMQNLDYIADLGMTAIWFTPVFENDMTPEYGAYHGYAATDMYRVDRRFGSNEEFTALVDAVHARGMTVIMDMIHNHVGDRHWWMDDLPTSDWVHSLERFGTTSYRTTTAVDPYAAEADRDGMEKAWFVSEMPDLGQTNDLLATYLIQNTVWWIETSGVDGIRMDTYPYADKHYMARWAEHVLEEFPDFNIVGETWMQRTAHTAYWQRGFRASPDGYESPLPSVTDFPMHAAFYEAIMNETDWTGGLSAFYFTLAQDFLYPDPPRVVAFLDNHDLPRVYSLFGEDEARFQMAYALLMTLPRTPQVYYGTELAMPNGPYTGSDGYKRSPMLGGWPGDERSVFTAEGRTERETRAFDYVRTLTRWRRYATAVHHGRTTQFLPRDNVYVLFRYTDDEAVMTILNRNEEPHSLGLGHYAERLDGYTFARDVVSGTVHSLDGPLEVPAQTTLVLELAR